MVLSMIIVKLFQSTILLWSAMMILVFFIIITDLINLLIINRINVLPVLFCDDLFFFFIFVIN